jgi:hypothetical protein|tara:strand:+ start:353 stop:640 length:288 start_codon:yes stop_codon:yes gene_type:complete
MPKRKQTKHLNNRDKFLHFSGIRVPKAIRSLRQVKNLSNKRYYEYTDGEKKELIKDLNKAFSEMKASWTKSATGEKKEKRLSYWEEKKLRGFNLK